MLYPFQQTKGYQDALRFGKDAIAKLVADKMKWYELGKLDSMKLNTTPCITTQASGNPAAEIKG